MAKRRLASLIASFALIPGLAGCFADNFGVRAVQYNLEAEKSQDQTLILNILRASMRRPLEFSGVQTVSGTASLGGTLGLSFPFHALNAGTGAASATTGTTYSGGPTFAVNVLDTQEFYQGILKPIPMQIIDYYFARGLPKTLIFNLLFSSITITQSPPPPAPSAGSATDAEKDAAPKWKHVFLNSVEHGDGLALFQSLVEALIRIGIKTQHKDNPTTEGPLLTRDEAARLAAESKAVTAQLNVKEKKICDLSDAELYSLIVRFSPGISQQGVSDSCDKIKDLNDQLQEYKLEYDIAADAATRHQLKQKIKDGTKELENSLRGLGVTYPGLPLIVYSAQKPNVDYAFCFDQGPENPCGGKQKAAPRGTSEPTAIMAKVVLPKENRSAKETGLCELLKSVPQKNPHDDGKTPAAFDCARPFDLEFTPRSVYSVIYYLGTIVRAYLDSENGEKQLVTIKLNTADENPPYSSCLTSPAPPNCEALFLLEKNPPDAESIATVEYENTTYGMTQGKAAGRSFEVLDLVTELLALNKSAKDLPAASVFTLIGTP
jgi:hypothetical protein